MKTRRLYAEAKSFIIVNSDAPLLIMVRDDTEHQRYLIENHANFHGGFFTHFPALIQVPANGYWNVCIKWWGFYPEDASYSIEVFQESVNGEPEQ